MSRLTFAAGGLLALIGMATALAGVFGSDFRAFTCGLVLIAGGGVFAMLYVGTRRTLPAPLNSPEEQSAHAA